MHDKKLLTPFWEYSAKLKSRILNPRSMGTFSQEEAFLKAMRLVVSHEGDLPHGAFVKLYFLIDEEDGVIADARFQAFGPSSLIGAADIACEVVLRKNYDQARRISAEILDKELRDKASLQAFPEEAARSLNLVLFAIENAADQCMDIPVSEIHYVTPVSTNNPAEHKPYPGFELLTKDQKITVIEQVIQVDIRPYIELDAGGIRVLDLKDNHELLIAYEGACTSCYSATGSTLNAIEQILKARVHASIYVTPDLSFLKPEK